MGNFLAGKVVAVTGAGRGIGRAVALAAAAQGARVVVNDYGVSIEGGEPSSEIAESVVKEIEAAGGEAVAVADDISTMAGGQRIVDTALARFGRIDGVVCVAGILRERMLFNMSEEEWDPVVATHLKGTFTVFRAASAVMRKQQGGGTLVGFTSGNHQGSVAQANYSAAKGGIISLVRSAALGLHKYGVTANAVAPVARTRMSANVPMELKEIGEPEDVAALVVYLLSDRAREEKITGQVYTIMRPEDRGLGAAQGTAGGVRGGDLDAGADRRLPAGDGGGGSDADARAAGGDGGRGGGEGEAQRVTSRRGPAPDPAPRPTEGLVFPPDPKEWTWTSRSTRRTTPSARRPGPGWRPTSHSPAPPRAAAPGSRSWAAPAGSASAGTPGQLYYGNRHATLTQQVVWAEEYARTTAPTRVGHIGENLLAPTLVAYGTDAQKQRFLPAVARGEELWCQGYSEPGSKLRPRRGADRSRAGRRRPVRRHRPEDLDLARPGRRLVLRPRPHHPRLAAPPRIVVPAGADGPAGPCRGAPDPSDVRD